MAYTYHALSAIEDILEPLATRGNCWQKLAIENLIGSNLFLLDLTRDLKVLQLECKKIEGGEGGQEEGWVVDVGVTHTISEKNSDNSYSKKIFKSKALAKKACDKQAIVMKKVIQSYIEDELTDEEWLKSLKLHGKQKKPIKKGCGQPKT